MLIGKILLKRYQIVEEIGSGGFGHTYKAIDTAFPGKPHCVVKHLSPHNDDSKALEIATRLFETEATVLSRLGEQDQIPRLFSYFEEDGEFYLVQELIKGQTLSQEFQSGRRWSEEETVNFLRELLDILSVVHQENTIHRDLKPANIMRRDSDGKLVLIDFGAVKEILTVDRDGQTDSTVGIGSLTYMPLEQARGRPGKYSDVYAVGMLGVQALTGLTSSDLPHDPERFREILIEEQIEISPKLESLLCTMISYQPTDRFADAAEALKALPDIEQPKPTPIPEPTPQSTPSPQLLEPTVPINRPNFPKKLLLGVLGATALLGAAGVYVFKSFDRPNYAQLETYLQNQEWEQANTETDQLILEVAGENSALDAESSNNLPCNALEKIDNLWSENSNGRFGFTPQKKAYLETGNEFDEYVESTYEAFGERVDWRIFGAWKRYDDLNFAQINPKITPSGYLPSPGKVAENKQDLRIREREMLLSRFNACGL